MKNLPPEALGPALAFAIGVLRGVLDQKETKWTRITLEGLICSGLAVGAGAAINAMGMDQNWIIAVSSFIGWMGTVMIRMFVIRFISRKVDSHDFR